MIKDRIEKILKHYNLSASKFAETIDTQRSSISHILSGRNRPSLELLQRILEKYPEIDALWLINGKNEMFTTNNTVPVEKEIQTSLNFEEEDPIKYITPKTENKPPTQTENNIERIIIFYKNKQFVEYKNN